MKKMLMLITIMLLLANFCPRVYADPVEGAIWSVSLTVLDTSEGPFASEGPEGTTGTIIIPFQIRVLVSYKNPGDADWQIFTGVDSITTDGSPIGVTTSIRVDNPDATALNRAYPHQIPQIIHYRQPWQIDLIAYHIKDNCDLWDYYNVTIDDGIELNVSKITPLVGDPIDVNLNTEFELMRDTFPAQVQVTPEPSTIIFSLIGISGFALKRLRAGRRAGKR